MGNEQSGPVAADTPPLTLSDRTLPAVADLISRGAAKRIVVLTGAGISTSAGIPDFRSPETGLYANLARLKLPRPEAVFDLDFFRRDPRPFYVLAKELYPGRFRPTVSHAFVALLARRRLLHMLFTQNIDCLERAAGVPADLIVEAHGSFAAQRCIACKRAYPDREMRRHVAEERVPRCVDARCDGLVKPDIVFFGEAMPSRFYDKAEAVQEADLVLILGTSLSVQPFCILPARAAEGVPRVLFNREQVGGIGSRADDVLALGDCDSGVRKLADALGWRDELESTWKDLVGGEEAARQESGADKEAQEEVAKLADDIEAVLKLDGHADCADTREPLTDKTNSSSSQQRSESDQKPTHTAAATTPQERSIRELPSSASNQDTSSAQTHQQHRPDRQTGEKQDQRQQPPVTWLLGLPSGTASGDGSSTSAPGGSASPGSGEAEAAARSRMREAAARVAALAPTRTQDFEEGDIEERNHVVVTDG